jgi:UDP-glucose 4-epimerase
MKIILTGGTGFIGSYILNQLLSDGHDVTVLARNANKIQGLHTMKNVRVLEISMTDFDKIPKALIGHDACIHVALNYNAESAFTMLMSDTAPSIFLATEAAKAGIKQFIYTSSIAAHDNIYSISNPPIIAETNSHVIATSKLDPHSYYGATKAATEDFLLGIAGETSMRVTFIKPGYTFGNPVFDGACTQPDRRFHSIVESALKNDDIELTKNDGTHFIWAGDLAKIYSSVLKSDNNRRSYFGLSSEFTSWLQIAEEAKQLCGSSSKIIVNDLGWGDKPIVFDVSDYKKDFGYTFLPYPHITEHLKYLIENSSK